MASFNRVVLVGNMTRDPELRYLPSGMAVTDIGLAVNDRYKKDNQWVDDVTFVDVTLWGRTAEVANEYAHKGTQVLVEGRLKLDQWEGQDGQKRSKLKGVGKRLVLLGRRADGSGGGAGGGASGFSHDDAGYEAPAPRANAMAGGPPAPPQQDDIPF